MKLPNLAVIFIIIILPLSVVLSTYMQLQIDVLNQKEELSTRLLDATYDGILSFELNSLSVDNVEGHSVKSYVSDAVNTFFTTMSINMGSSGAVNTNLQAYVPAILFTTYDGYYIYSPVKTKPVLLDDNKGIAKENDNDGELLYDDGTENGTTGITDTAGKTTFNLDEDLPNSYNYMVKPFIYYSATYASDPDIGSMNFTNGDDYAIVINYSLDNHVALYGRYADGSVARTISKSGYLTYLGDDGSPTIEIEPDSKFYIRGILNEAITSPDQDIASEADLVLTYSSLSKDEWIDLIETPDTNYCNGTIKSNDDGDYMGDDDYPKGYFENGGIEYLIRGKRYNSTNIINNYTEMSSDGEDHGGESIIDYTLDKERETGTSTVTVKVNGCEITDVDAKEYYLKSYFFSEWVQRELADKIKIKDIRTAYSNGTEDDLWMQNQILVNNQGIENYTTEEYLINLKENKEDNDPELDTSLFAQHKRQVIQNSIQYNLNSAISTYNDNYKGSTDFSMPAFTSDDWDKILTKVSMATFMQGVPCGTTTWGDYAIATSTNNKVFVNKNNLYFLKNEDAKSDLESAYHYVDCSKLHEEVASSTGDVYADMSFEYAYDSNEQAVTVYAVQEGANFVKYYFSEGKWYYWNGLIVDDEKAAEINANKRQVGSVYVETTEGNALERMVLVNFVIDSSNNFHYFEYAKQDDNGYLVPFTENLISAYNPYDEKYSIEPSSSENVLLYDHMNVDCYWCMMSANYDTFDFNAETCSITNSTDCPTCEKIRKAWYTYIAKYRNNQFNMTDAIQR